MSDRPDLQARGHYDQDNTCTAAMRRIRGMMRRYARGRSWLQRPGLGLVEQVHVPGLCEQPLVKRTSRPEGGAPEKYPLKSMRPGDAFMLEAGSAVERRAVRDRLRSAVSRYKRVYGLAVDFRVYEVPQGVRVVCVSKGRRLKDEG